MFTGIGNNPITEDLAYYNQLTKKGEAHKATCLCSRTTLNLRIPRITPNIAHANISKDRACASRDNDGRSWRRRPDQWRRRQADEERRAGRDDEVV